MQLPKTKAEAKALRLPRFFTGKPCDRGHIEERYVSGHCIKCVAINNAGYYEDDPEKFRERNASWVKENPDKVKEYSVEYRKTHAAELHEKDVLRRKENPNEGKECAARYRKENLEEVRKKDVERYWANRTKRLGQALKYQKHHPEKFRARTALRRAQKNQATPKWLTDEQWAEIDTFYVEAALVQQITGVKHHVDHIYPYKGKDCCGLNVPWNLQILTGSENCSKNNRIK